jgi:hypothetical protein
MIVLHFDHVFMVGSCSGRREGAFKALGHHLTFMVSVVYVTVANRRENVLEFDPPRNGAECLSSDIWRLGEGTYSGPKGSSCIGSHWSYSGTKYGCGISFG